MHAAVSRCGFQKLDYQYQVKGFKIPLPPLETQQAIVAEIEAERALVSANRELVERMEGRIAAAVGRVWGNSL